MDIRCKSCMSVFETEGKMSTNLIDCPVCNSEISLKDSRVIAVNQNSSSQSSKAGTITICILLVLVFIGALIFKLSIDPWSGRLEPASTICNALMASSILGIIASIFFANKKK